jgi:omega-6 fatty acid desaturase (delta-12 desaturase)
MPQYVWAQHHNYHHATNGNWSKYRGPLSILSVDEYDALSKWRQWTYVHGRNICLAPFGGFLYLIFNPRVTWARGTAALILHVVRGKLMQPELTIRVLTASFSTPYWKSSAEYRHMTFNNLVLLAAWVAMSWLIGPLVFFPVYLASLSFAGGAGIVLFTVQHNFEHSYASGDLDWDCDGAAIHGTSYLCLPLWLNWLTANIGYHHVHHISARIPNYRLADCHAENQQLFLAVKRLELADIGASLKFLLWDAHARQIISVAEYESARLAAAAAVA